MTRLLRHCLMAACLAISGPASAAAPQALGADHGLVVSAHALASAVGIDILKRGGNVVDAAVAVGYALAVVYPAAGNLGGGGFMTIRFADGRTTFMDFREKAPLAAARDMFLDRNGAVVPGRSVDSWMAVAVPGSVAGLEAARERFGTMTREALIAPALHLARDGFTLGEGDAALIRLVTNDLARDPSASAIFLPDGKPPEAGTRFVQADLAETLAAIVKDGPAAFYGGAIGRRIAAASAAGGGLLSDADLASYRVRELAPVQCTYRGFVIHSAPPPSSGGTTLCEILNIAEGYDLHALGFHGADEVHVLAEAMRDAYRDRNAALGDPAFVDNPVAHLTDKGYAATLRGAIPPEAAVRLAGPPPATDEHPQTTHYSIADAAGNAVSVTTTLNGWFGARRVAAGTGIVMNNEMDDFTAKPDAPNLYGLVQGPANAIQPGKTPLSSMSPTIVDKDGRLVMVIGSPGGSRIITTVAEAIINVVDHGMTIAEAVDAPRIHMQGRPDVVEAEAFALSPDTAAILRRNGYTLSGSASWGMAAGILAGEPRLGTPTEASHALSLTGGNKGFALYGAEDVRSPTGAAVGY